MYKENVDRIRRIHILNGMCKTTSIVNIHAAQYTKEACCVAAWVNAVREAVESQSILLCLTYSSEAIRPTLIGQNCCQD